MDSLLKNSKLSILVTTNKFQFEIKQNGDKILEQKRTVTIAEQNNKLRFNQSELAIFVKNFKTNNKVAQADFYKLMQSDKYPYMNIKLKHYEMYRKTDGSIKHGKALVEINIAGVNRQYEIPVATNKKGDNIIHLYGEKKMTIRDFGLEPPTAMMGLIQVSEWIEIELDFYSKVIFNP